jgi:hypothetical protein
MTTEYLTPYEVSRRYGIQISKLRQWHSSRRKSGPRYCQVGNRVLYKPADIEAFIEAHAVDPSHAAAIVSKENHQ